MSKSVVRRMAVSALGATAVVATVLGGTSQAVELPAKDLHEATGASVGATTATTAGTTTPAAASTVDVTSTNPVLSYGDRGAAVERLQTRLKALRYQAPVTGHFGAETKQAVLALQKVAGLQRDAVVGPNTWRALSNGVVPVARRGGTHLEIDLTRQVLLVVKDGRVARTFNASSGNGERYYAGGRWYEADTPTGRFSIYRQVNGMHESSLGLGTMWRPKFFTGGIAVHGSSSVPAYPASHGCVRVSNKGIDWIWGWGAPIGTSVSVYR